MPRGFCARKWFAGIVFSFSFFCFSAQANYNPIAPEIHAILSHASPKLKISVIVQSMQTGRVYFSKNASQFLQAASVQKLFTVTTALKVLGPDYRFPTRLLTDGQIQNGVLRGDLIFQFSGDPSLTESNIAAFVEHLQAIGVRRISGNVIVDDTAFAHIPYPPGWEWKDLSFDYAAPLNTVIIDRNQFGLSFVPTQIGERARLVPDLPPGTADFINQTRTTRYPQGNCPVSIFSNQDNQYLIRGCLGRDLGKQYRSLAIRNIQLFTDGLIRQLFVQHGIEYRGNIYHAKTPFNARVLSEHLSEPLHILIIHLLKVSDNLYADALLKKSGERFTGQPGSWQNGLSAVYSIISRDAGINLSNLHLVDGSGLSQFDHVTPLSISQLLHYIYEQKMLRDSIIHALPIAGVDGTLAGRMPNLARWHIVHAKTGSFKGVSTLAGFVKTRTHGTLSFVIMVNNVPRYRLPSILLQDRICEFLARS